MAYRNGSIPSHALKPLPGNNAGWLKQYAYAYWRLHYRSVANGGPSMAIYDGPTGRTYRSLSRQYAAKRIYGSNAATPGTSNHGLGKAVDLQTQGQRRAVDRWGAPYGLQKKWSDASWEWWHIRAVKAMGALQRPDPLRGLSPRRKAAANKLLYHRRERWREARTGKGRRYHRHLRWSKYWKGRVEKYARTTTGRQKTILLRVLKATDGRM